MIIEGLEFVLCKLKFLVNPYPELISDGWGHTDAALWTGFLYLAYTLGFLILIEMYRAWKITEVN